jgi:hypothetical protein
MRNPFCEVAMLSKLLRFFHSPLRSVTARCKNRYWPRLEALEERVVPDADYWQPAAGQASANWNVDGNWSLLRQPGNNDDAILDASRSTVPCVLPASANAGPQSVTLISDLPANYSSFVLTVAGTLQTPTLTINARAGGSNDIDIASAGQITVSSASGNNTMNWYGGTITGSGTLTVSAVVNHIADLYVWGSSSTDLPTLGAPLQLSSALPGAGAVLMDFADRPVQPLVVTGNASITVNNNATLQFDGQPLPGNTSVTAISNGDSGTETISVEPGGTVTSDGQYLRTVGMGLYIAAATGTTTATVTVDAGPNNQMGALQFTGTAGNYGYGLVTNGGSVNVNGAMTVNNSADLNGGTLAVASGGTLTLGQTANSSQSFISGGYLDLYGTLVAHGGFSINGGTLDASLGVGTVNMDSGNALVLSSGTITLALVSPVAASGLTVNGTFTASGGMIQDYAFGPTMGAYGKIAVNGNANLSTMCIFSMSDDQPRGREFDVLTWSGTRTGSFTFMLGANWTSDWDDTHKLLKITESD